MYKVYYVSENPDNPIFEPSSLVVEHEGILFYDDLESMQITLDSFGLKHSLEWSRSNICDWDYYYEVFPNDKPELVGEVNSVDELEALIRILILTFGE